MENKIPYTFSCMTVNMEIFFKFPLGMMTIPRLGIAYNELDSCFSPLGRSILITNKNSNFHLTLSMYRVHCVHLRRPQTPLTQQQSGYCLLTVGTNVSQLLFCECG